MGYDLTIGTPASTYDITGTDPDSQTTVFAGSNQSLNDVAKLLSVDPNALAQANPQIGDANQTLGPLQQVNVPAVLNPKWPRGTQVPDVTPVDTQTAQPSKPDLAPRPLGASEDVTGMKARLQESWGNIFGKENARQASFPNADAQHSLDENQAQASIPNADTLKSIAEDQKQASIADKTTPEWRKTEGEIDALNEQVAAKKKLNDLGLPPDPPKITNKDVAEYHLDKTPNGEETAEKGKEQGADRTIDAQKDYALHQVQHEMGHRYEHLLAESKEHWDPKHQAETLEAFEGYGKTAGKAATASGLGFAIANMVFDNIENTRQFNSNRDIAKIEMHGEALNTSNALMDQKFPQKRPLNDQGKQQEMDVVNKWKDGIDKKFDSIFEDIRQRTYKLQREVAAAPFEPFKSAFTEDYKKDMEGYNEQLGAVLKQGTVELANQRMAVFYDPRNWSE